ncbi:MAG: GlsB/YeaQ/YmgE family stress response membrane protein [Anaerolineae bacterium]
MFSFIGDVWWLCCGWIIVGGLAGGVARYIMGSKDRPFISDLILGVAGSLVGNLVLELVLDTNDVTGVFILSSFIAAVIGSIILIFIGRTLLGNRR